MKRLALGLAVLVLAGCASHARKAAPTATVPPPPPPAGAPAGGSTGKSTPPPAGAVTAPWDTAGSASAKAARRNHVYPKGTSALGQELVDSLPDPATLAPGAVESEPAGTSPTPTPTPTPAAPAPPVSERGCWEVQVLVTTNEGKARDEANRIEKALNLAAWVRNDGSIYRVRVGGCLTSDGAAELADRLRHEGYPEAFRVMREP